MGPIIKIGRSPIERGFPSKYAPSKFALAKFALAKFAPTKFTPTKFAPAKFAPSKFAPSKFVQNCPTKFAPYAPAKTRSANLTDKFAPSNTLRHFAPISTAAMRSRADIFASTSTLKVYLCCPRRDTILTGLFPFYHLRFRHYSSPDLPRLLDGSPAIWQAQPLFKPDVGPDVGDDQDKTIVDKMDSSIMPASETMSATCQTTDALRDR